MKFYYFLPKSTYFFRIINFVSKYLKPSLPHKNDTYFPAAGTTRYPHTKQTKTYQQAKRIKEMYYKYPPPNDNGKPIINVKWQIFPITRKEVIRGIWREVPF